MTKRRIASRCCWLLLSSVVAVVLAGAFGSAALAKGDDLPLNIRIVGAAGDRHIDFASGADPAGATIFRDQVANIEPMAPTLVFGPGPAGRRAPGLTSYYEIDFTQPLAADRFPWNGMGNPHFYFYPAHGGVPAYVRLHVTRGSQPAVDGWLPALPQFADLVTARLNGLAPFQAAPQPPASPPGWWFGAVLLLVGAGVLVLQRVGYFMPVVAMPRTK
jgi:hypothetical protein